MGVIPCPLFTWQAVHWPWRSKHSHFQQGDFWWNVRMVFHWTIWTSICFDWMKHDHWNFVVDTEFWIAGNGIFIRWYSPAARRWYSLPEDERIYDPEPVNG